MSASILLDLSRLLSRAHRCTPTGIDRVELAYAVHLQQLVPERCRFVMIDFMGRMHDLPMDPTRRFVAAISALWCGQGSSPTRVLAFACIIWLRVMFRPRIAPKSSSSVIRPVFLLVSHKHLLRRRRVASAIAARGARLVAFVHDLIPIEYPEYVRRRHAERHVRRIETIAVLADAVVSNSQATETALRPWLVKVGRSPPLLIAPLGVEFRQLPPPQLDKVSPPYFVVVGTIEPRKNHLLLLHLWRRLAERHGKAAPRLVLVGRRGWENENIVDLLERSPAIIELVSECPGLSDQAMQTLLRGSRAALFPSFAEGYGLPLAEALTSGVPALCGDVPALREVGGEVPEYFDPLDGIAWLEAIEAYSLAGSGRRAAQLERLASWRAPRWSTHFQNVVAFLDTVTEQPDARAHADREIPIPARRRPETVAALSATIAGPVSLRRSRLGQYCLKLAQRSNGIAR